MPLDLKPRLLVHTTLGDYVIDPWATGSFDLSPYGVTGYEVNYDAASGHFVVLVHHVSGTFTLDPFATGAKPDLTAYGITDYEVVFGMPNLANSLTQNLTMWAALGALIVGGWLMTRRR